jgi:hypothetical protein
LLMSLNTLSDGRYMLLYIRVRVRSHVLTLFFPSAPTSSGSQTVYAGWRCLLRPSHSGAVQCLLGAEDHVWAGCRGTTCLLSSSATTVRPATCTIADCEQHLSFYL